MRVVFVHGACVKDGSWWWHRTAELLAKRDVVSEAPALPSCGETGEPTGAQGPGLVEDVAAVRGLLTASDEPTVVVAHSYGGIVTAQAAAGVDAVRHLLLVSSYLPEVGQCLSSFGGEEPAPFLDIDPEGGTFTVRPDALAETFLQDCDPGIQRQATDKTARQSLAVLEQPVQSAAWQQVASTYAALRHREGLVLLQPDLPDELHGSHVGQGWVYVAVSDPDAHFARARAAGAEVLGEPHEARGDPMRGYSARDLEGNLWSFGTDRPGR